MRRLQRPVLVLLPALLAACVGSATATPPFPGQSAPSPPTACLTTARDDHGVVAAWFPSTIGAIRALPAVSGNPLLARYSADQSATVCYIDGQIPKGPPPPASGTIAPSFDRAVVVVVDQNAIFVAAGYRQNLPIESP